MNRYKEICPRSKIQNPMTSFCTLLVALAYEKQIPGPISAKVCAFEIPYLLKT